jgi:hypothetical protein
VGSPEPHAKPRPSRLGVVGSALAGLIGASALAVSGYTAYLQRQQTRAQVWPRVDVSVATSEHAFEISLHNRGTGPAIVRALSVSVDGTAFPDWDAALKPLVGPQPKGTVHRTISHPGPSWVLAAGEQRVLLRIESDVVAGELSAPGVAERLSMTVCYCSVLGDCWLEDEEPPREAPSCAPPPVPLR